VESRFSATPVATNGDDARLSGDVMSDEEVRVWIEQKLCTGDGLCTQYAPDVFEFGGDGLA
jgi:hypothetical protein